MEKDLKQVNVESARIFNTFLVVAGCCVIIFALVAGFSTINNTKQVKAASNSTSLFNDSKVVELPSDTKVKDKKHFKLIATDEKSNVSYYLYIE